MTRICLLAIAVAVLVGCSSSAGKATEEDKKNLTNLIENGIGTGPPGSAPTGASEPAPASGQVDAP